MINCPVMKLLGESNLNTDEINVQWNLLNKKNILSLLTTK